MLQYLFQKMQRVLVDNMSMFANKNGGALLSQLRDDSESYKSIDFYHPQAKAQLAKTVELVTSYHLKMTTLVAHIKTLPASNDRTAVLRQLQDIIKKLAAQKVKFGNIQNRIPDGILDVKRVLYAAVSLSEVKSEDDALQKHIHGLKKFLTNVNQQYTAFLQQETILEKLVRDTTLFYWEQIDKYRALVNDSCVAFTKSLNLTPHGEFVLKCLRSALQQIPNSPTQLLTTGQPMEEKIAFYAPTAIACCKRMSMLGKTYFHLPHDNEKYHFDYDPTSDLCGTGGDCFGQCMNVINSLVAGDLKILRPSISLINYQLDQGRPWGYPTERIARAETEVSATSTHNSLQWDDLQSAFSDEAGFLPGCIAGLSFTMNSYTMSQRSFTAGHIVVVAKLDSTRNPYKYIVYEKELGLFGLVDEESLKLVMQTVLALYKGMNYSKAKLTQYEKASDKTYELFRSIKPVQNETLSLASSSRVPGTIFHCKGEERSPDFNLPSVSSRSGPK